MSFGTTSTTNTALTPPDYTVPHPGNDGISSLTWSPTSNILVSTNWDGGVRCWEVQEQKGQVQALPKAQVNHENNSPVLCSTFSSDGSTVFTGGADNAVRMWNLSQGPLTTPNSVPQQIGAHSAAVSAIGFLKSTNIIVSGSYDKKLLFWDARTPNPVHSIELPERCYDLDVRENLMVVATAERHVLVYDVSGQPKEHIRKVSPLKYQTRCLRCFPDMTGFAIGSIEGRVGIQYYNRAHESKNFSFKCHRKDQTNSNSKGQDVYSVNAIAFHPVGKFATVGSDGVFTFWDKDNKQKLKGFPAVGNTIPCANFNAQGNLFAYAKSYDWSQGSGQYAPGSANEIAIHVVQPDEMQPRTRNRNSR
mmetsp:Transcript_16838/g.21296  ORF Transcript_16838/g.21296 Transcript_16838/m.21296 type:complete len:362 (-) Transcript_16838:30-1115(-)